MTQQLHIIENVLYDGSVYLVTLDDEIKQKSKDYQKVKLKAYELAKALNLSIVERKIDVCFVIIKESGENNQDIITYEILSDGQSIVTTKSRFLAETLAYNYANPGNFRSVTRDLRKKD